MFNDLLKKIFKMYLVYFIFFISNIHYLEKHINSTLTIYSRNGDVSGLRIFDSNYISWPLKYCLRILVRSKRNLSLIYGRYRKQHIPEESNYNETPVAD